MLVMHLNYIRTTSFNNSSTIDNDIIKFFLGQSLQGLIFMHINYLWEAYSVVTLKVGQANVT